MGTCSIDLNQLKDGVTQGINGTAGIAGQSAYNTMCANSAAIAATQTAASATWQTVLHTFLLAAGYAKQYDAIEKQGELADAQRDAVQRNMALNEKQFNSVFLPAYQKADQYFFGFYRKQYEPKLKEIVECGLKECEYTPDYNRWISRGLADVAKVVNGAKLAAKRVTDCYSAGACCDQEYRFADMQARLTLDTITYGRIYEDDRKLRIDQTLWGKQMNVASLIQNIGSMAQNTNSQGKQGLIQSLQAQTSAIAGFDAAVGSGFSALNNSASFYGSLGSLVGNQQGTAYGNQVGGMVLGQTGLQGLTGVQPGQSSYRMGTNFADPFAGNAQPSWMPAQAPVYSYQTDAFEGPVDSGANK